MRSFDILANAECWRPRPPQGAVEPVRALVVDFALIDVLPPIAAREAHVQPENLQSSSKKGFFNTIAAKRILVHQDYCVASKRSWAFGENFCAKVAYALE